MSRVDQEKGNNPTVRYDFQNAILVNKVKRKKR